MSFPQCKECGKYLDRFLVTLGSLVTRHQKKEEEAHRLQKIDTDIANLGKNTDSLNKEIQNLKKFVEKNKDFDPALVLGERVKKKEQFDSMTQNLFSNLQKIYHASGDDAEAKKKLQDLEESLQAQVVMPLQTLFSELAEPGNPAASTMTTKAVKKSEQDKYVQKVQYLFDSLEKLNIISESEKQALVSKSTVRFVYPKQGKQEKSAFTQLNNYVKEIKAWKTQLLKSEKKEITKRKIARGKKAVLVALAPVVVFAASYLIYQAYKYTAGILKKIEKQLKNIVQKFTKAFTIFLEQISDKPQAALGFMVVLAITLNISLHQAGLVENSRTQSLSASKQLVGRSVADFMKSGFLIEFNKKYNSYFKRAGILMQPATIIIISRLLSSAFAPAPAVATAGSTTENSSQEQPKPAYTFDEALRDAVKSLGPSVAGFAFFFADAQRKNVYAKSSKEQKNLLFDASGHAGVTLLNAMGTFAVKPENKFERGVVLAWLLCTWLSTTVTIIFYHTVPEYVVGMLLGITINTLTSSAFGTTDGPATLEKIKEVFFVKA